MTVLLTRPAKDNARIAAELARHGIESRSWPLSRVVATDGPIEAPADAEAIVFTSANGVSAFAARTDDRSLPAICVGARTASAAREAGFAEVEEGGGTVQLLMDHLVEAGYRRVFYARGKTVSVEIAEVMAPQGVHVDEAAVYATEPGLPPESDLLDALGSGRIAVVTIWSRRNAEAFRAQLAPHLAPAGEVCLDAVDLVAISENAAEPLGKQGFRRILVAGSPDAQGMVGTISAALR